MFLKSPEHQSVFRLQEYQVRHELMLTKRQHFYIKLEGMAK